MISVKWTGTAGFEISYENRKLLIDPYYSRVSRFEIFFKRITPNGKLLREIFRNQKNVSAIISGHTHFDHALDLPVIQSFLKCRILGNKSLDTLFRKYKKKGTVEICKGYEEIKIDEMAEVTMLPSVHGNIFLGRPLFEGEIGENVKIPLKASKYKTGQVFSPLLKIKDKRILYFGSAGFIDDAIKNVKCDVLFLCVPGWNKTKNYPEKIIEEVKPARIILIHFDDFSIPLNKNMKKISFLKMNKLIKLIKSKFPSIELIVPEPFEDIQI